MVISLLAIAGCTGESTSPEIAPASSLPNIEWHLPVSPGIPVIRHPAVPLEKRNHGTIRFVEDLTLGDHATDRDYAFYRPSDVAIDEKGRIYVLDAGNKRIQVFNHDGKYAQTIGGPGMGPGELAEPRSIGIGSDYLFASDSSGLRLSIWTLNGELQRTIQNVAPSALFGLAGLSDGTFVAKYSPYSPRGVNPDRQLRFARFSSSGDELGVLASLPIGMPIHERVENGRVTLRHALVELGQVPPDFEVALGGQIYMASGEAYEVLAIDASGDARWALHVPWPKHALAEDAVAAAMEGLRMRMPEVRRSDVAWPEHESVIRGIQVDGRGWLYVYPSSYGEGGDDRFPVDVYSAAGELLFAGWIEAGSWEASWGNYVYGFRRDDTGERAVVRYTLDIPF